MSESNSANVLCEIKDDRVAWVTINRPESLNAVDHPTIVELNRIVCEVGANSSVRVVVITGSGDKSFVVGADRQEIKTHEDDEERAKAFEDLSRATFSLVENLDKPSVCAVNGFAFGLGVQLALACTFRLASSNAKFGLPEINMGFFPSMGATQRLPLLIGEAKAIEMILTGETMDAAEAYRIGLVHKIVPQPELHSFVETFAGKLAEKSPVAIRLAIKAIRGGRLMSLDEGLKLESELGAECLMSEDSKEGRAAFGERRRPNFKGK